MIRICFICHGNICRSPMAEFIMKDKIKRLNLDNNYLVNSRATSCEEIGNQMHYGTKEILDKNNIPYGNHTAKKLEKDDYIKYDYFICMDDANVKNTLRIFETDRMKKVFKLNLKDVEDPWYTGNFAKVYEEINKGIDLFIEKLKNTNQ